MEYGRRRTKVFVWTAYINTYTAVRGKNEGVMAYMEEGNVSYSGRKSSSFLTSGLTQGISTSQKKGCSSITSVLTGKAVPRSPEDVEGKVGAIGE